MNIARITAAARVFVASAVVAPLGQSAGKTSGVFVSLAEGDLATYRLNMIIDDYATTNAGGVTISEMHAADSGDLDGDGIPDFVMGKRYGSHLDGYTDRGTFIFWGVRTPPRRGRAPVMPSGKE